jgi:twitching motility protein PilI
MDDPVSEGAPTRTEARSVERRSRLRQYQMQLLERVQAAKAGSGSGGKELGLMIGQARCLFDLTQVGEIVPAPPVSKVPLTRDWYLGLASIRGNLTGIVDLARYQLDERAQGGGEDGMAADGVADNRAVTFAAPLGFNCALLATRVLGLRDVGEMRAEADDAARPVWARQCFIDAEEQRWIRVDLALLVRETRFSQVGL